MNLRKSAFWLTVVFGAFGMAASIMPPFSGLIEMAANNVYPYNGPDIHFDYFTGALIGVLCGLGLMIIPMPAEIRPMVSFCWAIKFAVALFLTPVYEYAYGIDIDGYFWFAEMPGRIYGDGAGTWYTRMVAWAVFQVIGPSFHGGKVLFSFIGFSGLYAVYRAGARFMRSENPWLLALICLAPTGLFWSSTLGKDPLCLLGVGLYCYGSMAWLDGFKSRYLFPIVIGGVIATTVRSYFAPIMGIPLAVAFLLQSKRPLLRFLLIPGVLFGVQNSLEQFQARIRVDSFDSFVQYQARVAKDWQGGSSFVLPTIDSPIKLVLVAPLALATALFRPTIFEAHNAFSLAAALDNTILFVIFIYALRRSRIRELMQSEVVWMCSFVVMWGVLYGVGTGNLGAISRFKIQVLPIFITLLVYMARRRRPTLAPAE